MMRSQQVYFGGRRRMIVILGCCGVFLIVQQFFDWQTIMSPKQFATIELSGHHNEKQHMESNNATNTKTLQDRWSHHLPSTATKTPTQQQHQNGYPPPKIVVLPGPHKAGSTSVQYCMVDWTHNWKSEEDRHKRVRHQQQRKRKSWNEIQQRIRQKKAASGGAGGGRQDNSDAVNVVDEGKMPSYLLEPPKLEPLVLPQWKWPIPLDEDMRDKHLLLSDPVKGFASLMAVADDEDSLMTDDAPFPSHRRENVYRMFQEPMVDAWQQNYGIVFGSEEFDRIARPKKSSRKKSGSEILKSILKILPWEETIETVEASSAIFQQNATTFRRPSLTLKDLEAVIVYRAPRVDHLRSWWHQVGGPNQSLAEYLTVDSPGDDYFAFGNSARTLDPLGLAHRFVEHNIRTTVIDMTGISATKLTNLCHVVACEVLRDVECTKDSKIASLVETTRFDVSTRKWNQRDDTEPLHLTDHQLAAIDQVMRDYDCGWKQSLTAASSNGLFRVLHQHSLFSDCTKDDDNAPIRTISWMMDEIRNIAGRRNYY